MAMTPAERRERAKEWNRRYRKSWSPERIEAQRAAEREKARARYHANRAENAAKALARYHANPAPAIAYKAARRAAEKAARPIRKPDAVTLRAVLERNAIYAAAAAAVPRWHADARDDIVSALVLAVLQGDVPPAGIEAAAPIFIRRHYREFSRLSTLSLDDFAPGADRRRLIDTIPAPSTDHDQA